MRILTILLMVFLGGAVQAAPPTVEELLKAHQKSTDKLEDVQADATLDLKLTVGVFPYSEKLKGKYYYLKPNRHRLEFDDAPSYFDKAPSLFKWDLPSLDKYKAKVKGPYTDDGHSVYQLLFLPKNSASSTQSIACTFDATTWRLRKQNTSYRDGGTVALKFAYLSDTELPVLDEVKASVNIPSYSLTGAASIDFGSQKTNQGLDESVFPED